MVSYIGDRRTAEEVAREICLKNTDALIIEEDVSRMDQVCAMFEKTIRKWRQVIDINIIRWNRCELTS